MAGLTTVDDYVAEARRLLQDEVSPYRYSDTSLVEALNVGLLEARRLRPDLFLGRATAVPTHGYVLVGTTVNLDQQYRPALVYYMAGRVSARDDETSQESRASAFLGKFTAQLLQVAS